MSGRRPPPRDNAVGPSADEGATRQSVLPETRSDEVATRMVADAGVVGELRAALQSPSSKDKKSLALYATPDLVTVGRGSACDWQLDDDSLSRRHAQFRWTGRELDVEDLGSANGTKVNGRPARSATKVKPGDTVQLGTVIITFELRGGARAGSTADEQATRLTELPAAAYMPSAGSDPDFDDRPLPAQPTVMRPPPAPGAPNPVAAVFRPERDPAFPDEPTRRWDANAVLVKLPEPAIDWGEILRTHRRQLVLAGAAAWIAILLIVWSGYEQKAQRQAEEEAATAIPTASAGVPGVPGVPGVKVRSLAPNEVKSGTPAGTAPTTPATPGATPTTPVAAPVEELAADDLAGRAEALSQGIALYDQGRLQEALGWWKRLSGGGKDAAAQFMVELIEARLREAAGGTP